MRPTERYWVTDQVYPRPSREGRQKPRPLNASTLKYGLKRHPSPLTATDQTGSWNRLKDVINVEASSPSPTDASRLLQLEQHAERVGYVFAFLDIVPKFTVISCTLSHCTNCAARKLPNFLKSISIKTTIPPIVKEKSSG